MFKDNEIIAKIDALTKAVDALAKKIDALQCTQVSTDSEGRIPTWRTVVYKDVATNYEVSDCGEVRIKGGGVLPTMQNANGRPRVQIKYIDRDGMPQTTNMLIANAVARAFIDEGLPARSHSVSHIDGDVYNNDVNNLCVRKGAS